MRCLNAENIEKIVRMLQGGHCPLSFTQQDGESKQAGVKRRPQNPVEPNRPLPHPFQHGARPRIVLLRGPVDFRIKTVNGLHFANFSRLCDDGVGSVESPFVSTSRKASSRSLGTALYSRPEAAVSRKLIQKPHDAIVRRRRTDLG